ncbi:MAG TPA: hypothetical protein VIT38_08370 [Allosphingosinicella sp.]
MRKSLLIALLACAAPAPAAAQPASSQPSAAQNQTITVTGHRIADYRAALAACLARHCPVNEDVDASLALAEALFLDGDYGDARIAVRQSLSRNRRQSSAFPEPVADLYRADTRINRHLGMDTDALRSAHGVLQALQSGIPTEDHRHFTARLELSEVEMLMGRGSGAQRDLAALVENARAAGREDVAAIARLRSEYYSYIMDRNGGSQGRLLAMARDTAPEHRMLATGARILLARIYRLEGDVRSSDAMFAEIGRLGSSARRTLIFSPSYRMSALEPPIGHREEMTLLEGVTYGNTLKRLPENFEGKWVDVGFWIVPDGHVSGLEVLRHGAATGWATPLMDSIRGRIYSAGAEGSYRIERYTYTATFAAGESGTHGRQRSPIARVEFLDLTTEEAPPPPPAAGAGPSSPARYITE